MVKYTKEEREEAISEIIKIELDMNKFYSNNRKERPNDGDQWQSSRERLKHLRMKFEIT
jgi:hypothetical protein